MAALADKRWSWLKRFVDDRLDMIFIFFFFPLDMNSLFIIFEAPFPGNRNNTERRTPKYGERILGRFYDCQTFSHLAVVAHDVVVFDISSDSLRTFILICISYLIIFHFPSKIIRGYICVANNITIRSPCWRWAAFLRRFFVFFFDTLKMANKTLIAIPLEPKSIRCGKVILNTIFFSTGCRKESA